MSKQEAVLAYLKGSIGRREFIHRLSIAGVSATAAVTYANTLRPSSASAAGGAGSGELRRAFQADDYGTATEVPTEEPTESPIEEVLEAIAAAINALVDALTDILDAIGDILAGLGVTGPIADAATANIQQAIDNLQEQLTALGLARVPGGTSGVLALQTTDASSLSSLADVFDALAGAFSNVLQTTADATEANRVGPYAVVAGRHAAYFRTLLGEPAFPNAAEPSKSTEELQAALAAAS